MKKLQLFQTVKLAGKEVEKLSVSETIIHMIS